MTPKKARIRMYRVGFGDCFLVSFVYSRSTRRHVLIDFGTTQAPAGRPRLLLDVAEDIRRQTDGKLHVVVATHRHKDHVSGFATSRRGDGPGDLIRSLEPEVVLLPWTEDPQAEAEARRPTRVSSRRGLHLRQLADMHAVAESAARFAAAPRAGVPDALRARLAFLGEDNIRNANAMRNLLTMGRERRFLHFGVNPALGRVLPGVKLTVLGPPTLEQSDAIGRQRANDAGQFWMLAASAAAGRAAVRPQPLFAARYRHRGAELGEEVRWFTERLARIQAEQLLGVVTVLDNAMNNTSLILLLSVGGRKLLFPGDAQIENWEYALSKRQVVEALSGVDVYKVGHHGSRNATPKSLWQGFSRRSPKAKARRRLTTLLSTEHGKHGREAERTEVPRRSLVAELARDSDFHSTDAGPRGARSSLYEDIEIEFGS